MITNLRVLTPRLELRPLVETDFEAWRKGFLGRLEKQNEFDYGRPKAFEVRRERFKKLLAFQKKTREKDELYVVAIFDRKTGAHLGSVDIFIFARLDFQIANLGYSIHSQYWNRGYAKEAAKAALTLAFKRLKIHRLEGNSDPKNKASLAVLKSIGMKREGLRKKAIYESSKKKWCDFYYYAMTADDFGIKNRAPTVRTSL